MSVCLDDETRTSNHRQMEIEEILEILKNPKNIGIIIAELERRGWEIR